MGQATASPSVISFSPQLRAQLTTPSPSTPTPSNPDRFPCQPVLARHCRRSLRADGADAGKCEQDRPLRSHPVEHDGEDPAPLARPPPVPPCRPPLLRLSLDRVWSRVSIAFHPSMVRLPRPPPRPQHAPCTRRWRTSRFHSLPLFDGHHPSLRRDQSQQLATEKVTTVHVHKYSPAGPPGTHLLALPFWFLGGGASHAARSSHRDLRTRSRSPSLPRSSPLKSLWSE